MEKLGKKSKTVLLPKNYPTELYILEDALAFGYLIDNNLVGIAHLKKEKDHWLFLNTFVYEQYRGRGIHNLLIKHRQDYAKGTCIAEAASESSAKNLIECGFKLVGDRYKWTYSSFTWPVSYVICMGGSMAHFTRRLRRDDEIL